MNKVVFLAALLLSACSGPVPPPLAGAKIGGPFALVDTGGHTVTDRDFAGQYRIMYFGYTFCPDVCPTDVANITRALKQFAAHDAARAAKVRLIFVSVDPERDTSAVLGQFVKAFDPTPIGLTGSPQAIASVAHAYGVYYEKQKGTTPGSYLVDHSSSAYLMDGEGKPLALLSAEARPEVIAGELDQWVK